MTKHKFTLRRLWLSLRRFSQNVSSLSQYLLINAFCIEFYPNRRIKCWKKRSNFLYVLREPAPYSATILTNAQSYYVQIFCTKFLPNRSRTVQTVDRSWLTSVGFSKIAVARRFVKHFYTEIHEHPENNLTTVITSREKIRFLHMVYFICVKKA
jgi:hypothetical protein